MDELSRLLFEALQAWLGPGQVDAQHAAAYRKLFVAVARYDPRHPRFATEPSRVQACFTIAFEEFVARADAFARRRLGGTRLRRGREVAYAARTRNKDTGLRRGHMGPPLDINRASAPEFARVPGVGPATAHKLVAYRTARGRFRYRGEVWLSSDENFASWSLSAKHLTLDPPSDDDPPRRGLVPTSFPEYLGLVLAWETKRGTKTAPAELALTELVSLARERPYWTPGRWRCGRDLAAQAAALDDGARISEDGALSLALLPGKAMLTLVERLFRRAHTTICCSLPGLHPGGRHIEQALDALVDAQRRGVEVRLLLGARSLDASLLLAPRGLDHRLWPTQKSVEDDTQGQLHASTVVVDGRHLIVGSQSWGPASTYRTTELATYLDSPTHAREVAAYLDTLWAEGSSPNHRRSP